MVYQGCMIDFPPNFATRASKCISAGIGWDKGALDIFKLSPPGLPSKFVFERPGSKDI